MIVSDITNWRQEEHLFPQIIRRGIEFILQTDFDILEPGKYTIDGESMFMLVQEIVTEPKSRRRPESHNAYIDIQFLISGEERIGVCVNRNNHTISENLLDSKDIAFYQKVHDEIDILLKPGMFAVFFPSDIHRPCCSVHCEMQIRKAVIKIHKQLLSK